MARLGWGRTQVSAETKKSAWTDLWRYATSPEVGVQYPSIDKVMRFVKLVRKSIVEKVSKSNYNENKCCFNKHTIKVRFLALVLGPRA